MHQPWKQEHTNDISDLFKSGRVTAGSIRVHLQKSLDTAHDLESLAAERGVRIIEPFAEDNVRTDDGVFRSSRTRASRSRCW